MTDKVQKIREEVEKITKDINPFIPDENGENSEFESGRLSMATKILQLMDSLQEEPVSEDLGEYINELSKQFPKVSFAKLSRIAVRVAKWQKEQFEKNRLKHCNSITNEQAELEQGFIDQHIDKYNRIPTFLDAIEYGMRLQKEQMMSKAKSGTVQKDNQVILDNGTYIDLDPSMQLKPSFVGLKEGDRIKVIVIKED